MRKIWTKLAAVAFAVVPAVAFGATLHVTPEGAGSMDGSDWENACAGIQAAVDVAEAAFLAGEEVPDILVGDGTYSRVVVTNDFALDVRSANGAAATIIDGGGTNNCVRCYANWRYPKSPTFTGFTLRNGNARASGNWNEMDGGGAAGGTLVDCIIEDCVGSDGGGTSQSDTVRCIIRRCKATGWGGGGVEEGTHRNTLIYDCETYVAVIYEATLYNCTVADTAADSGYYGVCYNSSTNNCVFWGNTVNGEWADANDAEDPKFVGQGDYRPRAGSPAIDSGDADYAAEAGEKDLAGNERVQGAGIDRGCYEGPGVEGFIATAAVTAGNGSVSPAFVLAEAGASVTFTADTSVYGRPVAEWTVNGGTAAEGGDTFTVENLDSDVAVGVRFEVLDWWVDGANGNDGNAGSDETAPLQTIAKALDAAAPGETIYVAPGVYPPLDTTGKDCPVRIAAASLSRETSARTGARMLLPTDRMPIIDAMHLGPAAILGRDHILQGFCLRHGANWSFDEAAGGGGLQGGTALDCLLEDNFAVCGGGAGLATLSRCIIRRCRSMVGGALFDCRAFDSLIENNFAHVGGGALGGELLNCTLAGNRAHVGGGAARGNKSSSSSSMLRVIECCSVRNLSSNGRPGFPEDFEEGVLDKASPYSVVTNWALPFSPRRLPYHLPVTRFLVDPLNADYRLRAGSPFLRPGGGRSMPKAAVRRDADEREWDVRGEGFPRVVDGEMDWGAYEGAVEGWVVSVLVDGWGGRVSERTLVVPDGGEATVTAIEESRGFTGWLVDGEDAGTALTLTLSNVTTDHVAVACFERRTTEVSGGGAALQEAIDAAVDGDTLVVGPGTYSAIDATGRYLEIVSAEGPEKTFIRGEKGADAASCKRAATFSPAMGERTSRLSGFTLGGGYCMDDANGGGGVFGGVLDNCVIAGNEAAFGGGASQSTLTHCRIEGNTAGLLGGGAYMSELDNCLVTGNTVAEAGRAEVAARVEAALGTELPEGYAGGGGIAFSAAYLCTVAGNTAENADGGGGRRVVLDNSIVAGNSATGEGMHQDLGECSAEPQWFCSTEHGWEFWDDPVGFVDAATDAPFADAAGGDFSLRAGSACIDGADASFPEVAEDTDLAGGPRWRAGAPDIGCFEAGAIVPDAAGGVSATRSDGREDVLVAWDQSRGAEWFTVHRAESDDFAAAVQVGAVTNAPGSAATSFADAEAAAGTKYWYWVVACSEAGGAEPQSGGLGYWTTPLAIATETIPAAAPGVPYAVRIVSEGGIAPFAWSVSGTGIGMTTNDACTFTAEGAGVVPYEGYYDASPLMHTWLLNAMPLPFPFPFAGKTYTNVWINSDGVVAFGDEHPDWATDLYGRNYEDTDFWLTEEQFLSAPAIAVYTHGSYDSLATNFSASAATIIWSGNCWTGGWGSNVRFSLTLRPDGSFDFKYGGDGSTSYHDEEFARYGWSSGTGEGFLSVIGENLSAAPDRLFRHGPAPEWLSMDGSRLIGTPTAVGTNDIAVTVADGDGRSAFRFYVLVVDENAPVPTGYDAWAAANGLGAADEVTDGVPNLLRYAFDLPTGPLTLALEFNGEKQPVLVTPVLATDVGVAVVGRSVGGLASSDWTGAGEQPLTKESGGRIVFAEDAGKAMRFYRLEARQE